MRTALIVGGTGPTGPDVIDGMRQRGFKTAIFHSGKHEIGLPPDVEHIHGDAHFPESIAEALDGRCFDVVIAQYGRLRHLVDCLHGRTGYLVAIGGMNAPLAGKSDPRWGSLGRPAVVREEARILLDAPDEANKLGFKIAEASRRLFEARESGDFKATYIVYPTLYGPRQPGSPEWSVVRRIRDGRRRLILPDAGLRLESRGFVHNVALAPLLVVDKPTLADGKTYVVADRDLFTVRQRVECIAHLMGAELEIIDMPFELATPAHPLYRLGGDHRAGLADQIRSELGYTDKYDAATALRLTVDWLLSAADAITEIERQLADPFDYAFEDELAAWWQKTKRRAPQPRNRGYSYSHTYRHPRAVGEDWKRT
jgi:nucleoside-diphosphate-sugar epimerase